jgi:sugar O-acyltransferase (sialic acid O-acetyltransferase NeuD family)
MNRVIIIGADGLGEAVADILMSLPLGPSAPVPIGFVDENRQLQGHKLLGLPVFGTPSELSNFPHDAIVLAMADTNARSRYSQRLQRQGERLLPAIVHPTAILARRVTLGAGSLVAAGAIIGVGCSIGQGVILDAGCVLGHGCQVGDFAYVGPGANLGFDVVAKNLASIGAAATIVPGTRLGIDARVAEGAVVASHVGEGAAVLTRVSPRY